MGLLSRFGLVLGRRRKRRWDRRNRSPGPAASAIDALDGLTLEAAVRELHERVRRSRPPVDGAVEWAEERLGLRGPELGGWCDDAAWSWAAAVLARRRVDTGRVAELVALIDPPDLAPIEPLLARGRGLVLIGAHVGPPVALRLALSEAMPRVRFLVNQPVADTPIGDEVAVGDERERFTALASAYAHVRDGGALYSSLDGPFGRSVAEVSLFGTRVPVRRGLLSLVQRTGAPSVPAAAVWASDRIRIAFGGPLPDAGDYEDAAAFEDDWFASWARWLEAFARDPQNLRLCGSRLWSRGPGGLF